MSWDRLIHLVVGFIVLWLMVGRPLPRLSSLHWGLLVVGCALGTWVPDWDLVLGIQHHRSPLTHSFLPVLLLFVGMKWLKLPLNTLVVGFAAGVSSHLLWDIVFYGDVRWISGGNYDRLFLLINAAVLWLWATTHGRLTEDKGEKKTTA